ncbi:MAG: lytic transglycosylase domain-containing protein, partial [Pseudomonadota bacterium]|nr:lytic transglycosylase domain-containing protein [Pseudomonadota bacterium]
MADWENVAALNTAGGPVASAGSPDVSSANTIQPTNVVQQSFLNDAKLQQVYPGWPTGLTLAQMQTESGNNLDPNAVSPAGAVGMAQVEPSTLAALNKRLGTNLNPRDPNDALRIQFELMKENLQKFKNPWDALRAYNAGWNQNNWNNPETQNYVPTIQQKLKDNQQWETVSPNQSQTTPQQTTAPSTDGWSTVGTTSPQQPTSTALGAFGRGAETSALPTLGGLAAFTPGMWAGGAAGLAIGGPPGALIGGLAGGLATSTGAGYAVDKLQQYLLNKFPGAAKALGISQPQLQADIQQHPYAAFAGGLAPQALALRPSLEALTTAKGLIGAGAGAVIGGGQEAARELVNKEGLDTKKIAMATAAGALMNKPTFLGKAIGMGGPAEADTATTAASKIEATEAAKQANTPIAPGEQGELFSQQEAPATVSWLPEQPLDQAIAEDQQAQVNKRQMNLQLEQNPQTYYAGQEGVTAIHPDELTPFIEHTQNLTKAEQQSEPVQGELFNELDQRRFDQYGGQPEPKTLSPDEFAQTVQNIAEQPGTRFQVPENMEEAYNKYLDTVSDRQGALFDRPTIAENFANLAKQESVNRMLQDNPVIKKLSSDVQAKAKQVAQIRASSLNLDPKVLDQAQQALDESQAKLNTTSQNIRNTLLGRKATALGPYAKNGIVYMNSGLPLPDWIKNGLTSLLQKFHGVVFRTLNSVLRGPRQINSLADAVHAGIKGAIDKQANKVWETNTNQNAAQVLRNLPLVDRNREAVRDFIPSDQKPVEEIAQMAREAPD